MRIIILMAAAAILLLLNGSGLFVSFFRAEPLPRSAAIPSFKQMAPGLASGARGFPGSESNTFSRDGGGQRSGFIHEPRGFNN
jgi:hypothetical protein